MSGKAARLKGHSFERYVANDLRFILGEAKRGLQSRNNEDTVEDVLAPILAPECKAYKKNPPFQQAYRQAVKACPEGKIPLAVTKEDYKMPMVVLAYDDFLAIVETMVISYKAKNYPLDIIHREANWEKDLTNELTSSKKAIKERRKNNDTPSS